MKSKTKDDRVIDAESELLELLEVRELLMAETECSFPTKDGEMALELAGEFVSEEVTLVVEKGGGEVVVGMESNLVLS